MALEHPCSQVQEGVRAALVTLEELEMTLVGASGAWRWSQTNWWPAEGGSIEELVLLDSTLGCLVDMQGFGATHDLCLL